MTQRSARQPRLWGWLALLALFATSCKKGPELNPVTGKVLFKNEPLAGATVTFHPKTADLKAVPPTAQTMADGTFTVVTGDKEGAAAGDYIVTIICSELPPEAKKGGLATGGMDTVDRLKGAYANRDASKISVQIKKGPNQLEPFSLK